MGREEEKRAANLLDQPGGPIVREENRGRLVLMVSGLGSFFGRRHGDGERRLSGLQMRDRGAVASGRFLARSGRSDSVI